MQLEEYFDFLAPDDIRIKGTRVGIETVLYDYIHRSRSPEDIVTSYPSLTLEQVYATITYYLRNKEAVSAYLENWLEHGRRMRAEQERNPTPSMVRLRQLEAERMAAERKTTEYQAHSPAQDESVTEVAISIPDYISQTAEQYASRLGVSSSEFYAAAVANYVRELQKDDVTRALDQVYSQESSAVDPVIMQMQIASLPNEDW